MKTLLTVLLVIYISSVIGQWYFIGKKHSRGGEYSMLKPDALDILGMFSPYFNTMFTIMDICESINLSKFFRIKK